MNITKKTILALFLLYLYPSFNLYAGNIGGVFGPKINATDRSWQYRYANALGEHGLNDNWASRIHYQHALNDSQRVRGVIQYRDNQTDFHFDQFRLEYQWQFQNSVKSDSNWDSALRFDFVGRGGRGPEEFGMHWSNQWRLADDWNAKAIMMSFLQLGDDRASGLVILSRYSLDYKLAEKTTFSLESFNHHGTTANFGHFNEHPQQFGAALSGTIGELGYRISYLKGITNATPDDTLGLWLTYKM